SAETRLRRAPPPLVSGIDARLGPRHPARSPQPPARVDARGSGGRAPAPARAGLARSCQAHLGARLSRALGARARRPRAHSRARMRVTMLVRCLAMMRGGGETRHLAWMRELAELGVDVDVVTGRPLALGGPRHPINGVKATMVRSPYTRDAVYRWQHTR